MGRIGVLAILALASFLTACGRQPAKPGPAPLDVTVVTVAAKDTPVTAEYVAQTQSSQGVNIQARVSGFLDKRVYTEGSIVKAGQTLFLMDQKPFQAQVDAAAAAVQRNQAAMDTAKANLARTKPLAERNALSQKSLDDAQGQYDQAAAAVAQSQAQLESAKLNLSYTVITSPVTGISSFAAVADGTYVDAKNSQLTTVSVLSPMWVNFSVSENQLERIQREVKQGILQLPADHNYDVEILQADGTVLPFTGKITFADPSYDPQTGTFLVRTTVNNPAGTLRPNQYVRVRLKGAMRPGAILVPQRAVQQGGKGHFVWVVDGEGKARQRPILVGDWYGDNWFVNDGLATGDRLVVDGAQRLSEGAMVKIVPSLPATGAAPGGKQPPAGKPAASAPSGS